MRSSVNIGIEVIGLKKYLSVFMLYIRSSVYKVLALLGAMAVLQTVLFMSVPEFKMMRSLEKMHKFYGVEDLLEKSGLFIVFGVAFVLLTLIVCYVGCEFSGKQGYTLRRLRISEKRVFLMQVLSNTLFYALFWLCEIVIIRVLMQIYLRYVPDAIYTNQMLMLSFYRNELLMAVMPMSNLVCLFRNIIWVLAMGVTSAYLPYMQRRRKIAFSLVVMAAIVIVGFVSGDDISSQNITAVWAVMIIISALVRVVRGESDEKEA